MDQKDRAVCYRFVCDRYPTCRRARGKGCCIDWDDPDEVQVPREQCNEQDGWVWYLPPDPS